MSHLCFITVILTGFEPPHDETNKMTCAPSKLRSVLAAAQSDQSSLSAWRNIGSSATHSWLSAQQIDQTGLIWDFAGSTDNFVFNWSLCCSCLCMSTVSFCAGVHTFFYNIINFKILNVDLGKDRIFFYRSWCVLSWMSAAFQQTFAIFCTLVPGSFTYKVSPSTVIIQKLLSFSYPKILSV